MNSASTRRPRRLTTVSTAVLANALLACGVNAQTAELPTSDQQEEAAEVRDIVVTGSRIRRSTDTTSAAPIAIIGSEAIAQKGFVQVGEVLNEIPSNTASRSNFAGPSLSGGQSVPGQGYPNLFSLGPARTLSLLNGRRLPPTTSGLGDEATDVNIIPTGLLDRVDVVQGGGAAVYGSGAIAGVVNYVLKNDYKGLDLQAQYRTDASVYRTFSGRLTAGTDFADGRGNIAAEFNYSESSAITYGDRFESFGGDAIPNPAPGAGTNGVPATLLVRDYLFLDDPNGVVTTSGGFLAALLPFALSVGGKTVTIDESGAVVPKFIGTPYPTQPIRLAAGEVQYPRLRRTTLAPGVKRLVGQLVGHFDLTDGLKLSGEFLAARTDATAVGSQLLISEFLGIYTGAFPRLSPLPFTSSNPYLSPATVAQLSALSPDFAAGQPLFLAKSFTNQGSKYTDRRFRTDTYRGLLALSGDFEVLGRKMFWETSYSHAQVDQVVDGYNFVYPNVRNAADAVRNSAGQIVCAINNPVVTDPACRPLNIFGTGTIPQDTLDYVFRPSGNTALQVLGNVKNRYDDVLATLSGDAFTLPAGKAKFSFTYEHRYASSKFNPLPGDQAGIFFSGIGSPPGSGSYKTDEFGAELELPLLGGEINLPLVKALDVNGSYRYVSNSLAGKNSVWSGGLRWEVVDGLQFRGTRSRNFRAPSISQVAAPASVGLAITQNPCSNTLITTGPAVSVRAANCLALFTANPSYGLDQLPAGVGNTPANRLANFVGTPVASTTVTSGGNPNLENEISDTLTAGVIFQPAFIPGLTISADILRIKIKNGLTLFNTNNFAATCFDASPQPAEFCSAITFSPDGQIATGRSTAVNAANLVLHSEIYNIDYRLPLSSISSKLPGTLNLVLQATHNTLATTTFAGTSTRTDGTINLPSWVVRFDARYRSGPIGLFYSLNYLPSSLIDYNATVENSPSGIARVRSNARHDIAAEYTFAERYTLRFGMNDITNRRTSYPVVTYGDITGRTAFVSANIRFR